MIEAIAINSSMMLRVAIVALVILGTADAAQPKFLEQEEVRHWKSRTVEGRLAFAKSKTAIGIDENANTRILTVRAPSGATLFAKEKVAIDCLTLMSTLKLQIYS